MSYCDYEGRCGSCREYSFEGDNSKGYCRHYGTYYFPDNSCKHWEGRTSSSSFGCYITTACCRYKGLPDDCHELQTLREFRDGYLKNKEYGAELIQCYYTDAPKIVEKLNQHVERDLIYKKLYEEIVSINHLIETGKAEEAIISYLFMVYKLIRYLAL